MAGYAEACTVEQQGIDILVPYAQQQGYKVKDVRATARDRGDLQVIKPGWKRPVMVEVKVEERWTGNLYLERWSNYSRQTPGWVTKCTAHVLWYYFLDADKLVIGAWGPLKEWAMQDAELWVPRWLREKDTLLVMPPITTFQAKAQGKYQQLNDPRGYIVPVSFLQDWHMVDENVQTPQRFVTG